MKREKKTRLNFSQSADVTLGDLLGLMPEDVSTQVEKQEKMDSPRAAKVEKTSRIVLRRERKGRKGKTVTLVEGLSLSGQGLETVARRMRRDLGCGSHVEGEIVVLQGDQVERAFIWLEREGVSHIVKGN